MNSYRVHMIEPRCLIKYRSLADFAIDGCEQVHIAAQECCFTYKLARHPRRMPNPHRLIVPRRLSCVRFRLSSRCDKFDFVDKPALFRGLVPTKWPNGIVISGPASLPFAAAHESGFGTWRTCRDKSVIPSKAT